MLGMGNVLQVLHVRGQQEMSKGAEVTVPLQSKKVLAVEVSLPYLVLYVDCTPGVDAAPVLVTFLICQGGVGSNHCKWQQGSHPFIS